MTPSNPLLEAKVPCQSSMHFCEGIDADCPFCHGTEEVLRYPELWDACRSINHRVLGPACVCHGANKVPAPEAEMVARLTDVLQSLPQEQRTQVHNYMAESDRLPDSPDWDDTEQDCLVWWLALTEPQRIEALTAAIQATDRKAYMKEYYQKRRSPKVT